MNIITRGTLRGCVLWQDYRRLTALDYGPLGNLHPGTLTGDASLDATLGLVLGGVTCRNTVTYTTALSTPYFGVSFWIKAVSQTKTIVQRWNDSANKRAWHVQAYVSGGTCRLNVWLSTTGTGVTKNYYGDKVIGDDVLHHVAVGWDGANLLGWVDGAAITWTKTTDTAMDSVFYSDAPVNIGFAQGGYNFLTGSLRSMLVFNRGLTAADATTLYAAGV